MNFSLYIWIIILVALAFDFINGFHDAANSIATIVSTRVLKPQYAVAWAAFFNFIAFLFFELKVAGTIGKGVIHPTIVDPDLILGALSGAIIWNLLTWYFGIPSSSSHALIGGLAGAAVAKGGVKAIMVDGFSKIALSIFLSPTVGFILAAILFVLVAIVSVKIIKAPSGKLDGWFRKLQFISAALYSLGHGGNDAQKTMGIIAVLLLSAGYMGGEFKVDTWIIYSCQFAMGFGTLFGGWRIVKTMGMKITKLKPIGGFCAETAGAITLFAATHLGIPVSTTHTITGSIFGVGSVASPYSVRWGMAERIVIAWFLTIPASAFMSAVTWSLIQYVRFKFGIV